MLVAEITFRFPLPWLPASQPPLAVRPGVAVATLNGNLVVSDNTYTLNILEDVEEKGEIT
mgnify:CR=1 FL=1